MFDLRYLLFVPWEVGAMSARRPATGFDRAMDEMITERFVVPHGPLQSLTPEELGLDRNPVTITPKPTRARAWVRFGPEQTQVMCLIERWTDRAVGISFTVRDNTYRCWVWNCAVSPWEVPE